MIDQDKMRFMATRLRAMDLTTCAEAADAIDLLLAECALLRSRTNILSDLVGDLRSQRRAYASEFPMHEDGEPDEGRVHENIRKLKAELEAAAADKRDAERYRYLRSRPESVEPGRIDVVYWSALDESANEGEGLRGDALDVAIDAALAQRQGEGS